MTDLTSLDGRTMPTGKVRGLIGLIQDQHDAVALLAPIADTSTATAEDVAEAYNALLAALQG